VLHDHPARALLAKPNVSIGEADFWKATEIFLCTAGFAAWEIEMNNKGEPIGLWPMRPHWCSFMAGNGLPVRAVRYQPDGLSQPMYVPIDRVLLFTEFNPLRPQISSLSRTAVALRSIEADNAATDFLAMFFQQGASMPGVLVTDQVLNDSEAERIKARWREYHGGYQNWGDVAVLGKGTRYEPVSQTFKEMDFSNIDGRDEARICMVFQVPAMLVGAKVGLNASTYSNYAEARKAFYEETIVPRWKWFENIIDAQLLPKFDGDTKTWPAFDLSDVRALAEDETAKWARAQGAAGMNLITRDEARVLIGFDAIDNGEPVWLGGSAGAGQPEPEGDEPAGDMPMGANEMTDKHVERHRRVSYAVSNSTN
jgi:HK97 family phage portal protein